MFSPKEYRRYRSYGHGRMISAMHATSVVGIVAIGALIGFLL